MDDIENEMAKLADGIRAATRRTEDGRAEWIDGSIELAVLLRKARIAFGEDDTAFGMWRAREKLTQNLSDNDRAALIRMAEDVVKMRTVLEETNRDSYQHIWANEGKKAFTHVSKGVSSSPNTAISAPVDQPQGETSPAQTPNRHVPARSKLRDAVGSAIADPLLARFRNANRMFTSDATAGSSKAMAVKKSMLSQLIKRSAEPDYPQHLFEQMQWGPNLHFPFLPQRLLDHLSMPSLVGLAKQTVVLAETERRFRTSPLFGVTEPPLAAFNEATRIYTVVLNAKSGHVIDSKAVHKPVYASDEGKQPVIIRGTKLWPAEIDSGYRYDDLRCACGFVDDVFKTFLERGADIPLTTKVLKLKHLMSWFDNGYNTVGSTTEGFLKALPLVVGAYSKNRSEEMQTPIPRHDKADGNARA